LCPSKVSLEGFEGEGIGETQKKGALGVEERPLGEVIAVCLSQAKGVPKHNVHAGQFLADRGLMGDAHQGGWHRQISLLAWESVEKMMAKGLNLKPGAFAENLTTLGVDLGKLTVGSRLLIGDGVLLKVSQIGKDCSNTRCRIFRLTGDCIMPKEGVFASVEHGGWVREGDPIKLMP
jgi:MOSC domain-containing protein YiiM